LNKKIVIPSEIADYRNITQPANGSQTENGSIN